MIKVSELKDERLDYWAGKADGIDVLIDDGRCYRVVRVLNRLRTYSPSTDWSQGGPIIEREKFAVIPVIGGTWCVERNVPTGGDDYEVAMSYGNTCLIAAMRCFVASRFGEEVDDSQAHNL